MSKVFKSRYGQMVIAIIFLMALLFVRLFVLTVIQKDHWAVEATTLSVKSVVTPAPRGMILDRYGRVLAENVQSFSVRFSVSEITNEEANRVSQALIGIFEKNGDKYFDNFPILLENGGYVYTYQKEIEEWLASQGMPPYYTAQQAFDKLRENYEIDESLDKYAAQSELQNTHKVFPPISVKQMKFLQTLDLEGFLDRYGLEHKERDWPADETFKQLRLRFGIDKVDEETKEVIVSKMSDAEARKIMVVRNEVAAMGYRKYVPATIASNVSNETVVQVEEQSRNLPGVEVIPETKRIYPNGNTASHVLGYMGHISEKDKKKYVQELGYDANDMIGIEGLEKSFESTLKGQDGEQYVQVNVSGELVKVIEEKEPVKGKDIYTTIDLDLQKTAEDALSRGLAAIRTGGTFESVYGNYKCKQYPNATVGTVVALEVETGGVLALANDPNYNPNLFATGISKSDWSSLQSENPRNPLSPLPLYNVACLTAIQPGSTFKMVTATAALECGLDPKQRLYDGGFINIGTRPYGCLLWHTNGGSHGSINLAEALEVSCNYYFYDVSTGYDYSKRRSLGYSEPISIDKIMSYARQYGLGEKTGIEIEETVARLPSAEGKMDTMKRLLRSYLTQHVEEFFRPEVIADKKQLNNYIDEIVGWTEENPSRKELLKRMENVGLNEDMVVKVADDCKFTYYNYAQWTKGDEFNISIGQGENAYTPLQMANYVATIGNDGVHNKVSLINAIEGKGELPKEPGVKIDIKKASDLSEIIRGMKLVAAGPNGSLRNVFRNFPVEVAAKTGTAERAGKIHPPEEVPYIKANLSRIAPTLKWEDVEAEMNRLLKEFPETYATENGAVRQAVINLSGGKVTYEKIDAYKSDYDSFAWVIAMAPADDPKIVVAVLVFQGGTSLNASPIAREIIGEYLQLDKTYEDITLNTKMN